MWKLYILVLFLLDSFSAGRSYQFIEICGSDTDNYKALKLLYSDYQNSTLEIGY